MSSANRGGPERRRSAASNCLASSWLCLVDVEANNRTVDARTLGSSLSMASCRRVSLASGAFQTRPECVQRILGEIPWTGGALRFELDKGGRNLFACPLCAEKAEIGTDKHSVGV